MPREGEGHIAGAAAEIERAHAGSGRGEAEQTPLPPAVQPEALEVVDEIVASGNLREQSLHSFRALPACFVISIAHRGGEATGWQAGVQPGIMAGS